MTFVASDHGFAPQFLAIDASLPLVHLDLLSKPQTSNCRPATGEMIGQAMACWAGGTLQIYLNSPVVTRSAPATVTQKLADGSPTRSSSLTRASRRRRSELGGEDQVRPTAA